MTFEELSNRVLLKEYNTSEGDTLNKVSYILYNSNDGVYINALVRLNKIYDWSNLKAGQVIYYLDKENIQLVDEIL